MSKKEIEVKIERLIWRGRGLGSLKNGKRVIILPPVLPGEYITGEVIREKKDFVEVKPTRIIHKSIHRRPHLCDSAKYCGGCTFGFIDDDYEIELKKNILKNELKRWLGRYISSFPEITLYCSLKNWGYRWRGQVFVKNNSPHFSKINSNELIEIKRCMLFADEINNELEKICLTLKDGKTTICASPWDKKVFSEYDAGPLILPYNSYGINLKINPRSFFQANWDLNMKLVDCVVLLCLDFEKIGDLFAGCGNFAVPLSSYGKEVIAIENNPWSVVSLFSFIKENSIKNIKVTKMDLIKSSPKKLLEDFKVECLIVDPPRCGGGRFVHEINNLFTLKRIIWVSCDVVNTARDIKPLLQAGWTINEIFLFDMFPNTYHMEVVFVIDR